MDKTVIVATEEDSSRLGLQHRVRLADRPDAPLVFLVHGRAGNDKVMWTFARCIPPEWNVIAPQAPLSDPIGGFSWWLVGEQPIARNDINQAVDLLERFIDTAPNYYSLNPRFMVALGFSQGAGVLSVLLSRNPGSFRGLALLAGFLIKPEQTLPAVSRATEVFIAHGIADETVPISKAEWGRDWLNEQGFKVTFVSDDVGHKIGTNGMRGLKAWLTNL